MLLLLAAFGRPAAAAPPVDVCIDPEPPPWSYWKRDKDGNPTHEVTGFSVELVRRLFHKLGREVRFMTETPWTRCSYQVRHSKIGFMMDLYQDGPKMAEFLYSTHYNTLTPQLFTRRDHPIDATSPADLKRYRGCGVVGGAYGHYGLKDADLDLSANGYPGVMQKLKGGYCDFFVEELETLAGFQLGHEDYLGDPEIAHRPLNWVKHPSMHLATASGGADADLIPKLNALIDSMDNSGELEALWRKYAGDIPFTR